MKLENIIFSSNANKGPFRLHALCTSVPEQLAKFQNDCMKYMIPLPIGNFVMSNMLSWANYDYVGPIHVVSIETK